MRARSLAHFLALSVVFCTVGCNDPKTSLILGATTSTYDSGLLDALMKQFGEAHPDLSVRTIIVGSGEALELGRRGDVDLLLVHAPAAEERFVAEGHAPARTPLMSNEFVIVGPSNDPAGVGRLSDPGDAMRAIALSGSRFASRGDSSGTHEREIALWRAAGIEPSRPWHFETGQGQATTLQIANERQAYALTDRATFDVLSDILDLAPLFEGHPALVNRYSVLLPRRAAHLLAATRLAEWLTSEAGHAAIRAFRLPGSERSLFTPAEAAGGESDPSEAESDIARG